LLLYITLHDISETTPFWEAVGSCFVTMEKVLINTPDKMCVEPLSKIHDLTDKCTCQYTTQAVH
jgi:hypothetical protein